MIYLIKKKKIGKTERGEVLMLEDATMSENGKIIVSEKTISVE